MDLLNRILVLNDDINEKLKEQYGLLEELNRNGEFKNLEIPEKENRFTKLYDLAELALKNSSPKKVIDLEDDIVMVDLNKLEVGNICQNNNQLCRIQSIGEGRYWVQYSWGNSWVEEDQLELYELPFKVGEMVRILKQPCELGLGYKHRILLSRYKIIKFRLTSNFLYEACVEYEECYNRYWLPINILEKC